MEQKGVKKRRNVVRGGEWKGKELRREERW